MNTLNKSKQMPRRILLGIGFAAAVAGSASPAHALKPSTQGIDYIETITLQAGSNPAGVVTLKNMAASPFADDANIQLEGSTLNISLNGYVKCVKDKDVNFDKAEVYFGPAQVNGGAVEAPQALHHAVYHPTFTEWDGVGNGQWNSESGNDETFNVPLNSIKNGHPAVRFNPVEEFNKKLQQHVQGGGKKFEFLKQDQSLTVNRTISMVGWCREGGTKDPEAASATVTLKVQYKGDGKLTGDKVTVNAQVGQNMPNQIGQNPNLPFQLNNVQFQPNMPHYTGKCLPDQNPTIRMNFTVSGGKQGEIDLRVAAVSNTYGAYGNYFETAGIVKNPKNGGGYLDFTFPLKEMLAQDKYAYMAIADNKTYSHNMRIEARYKNLEDGTWSAWKQFDTAVFKHRCTPQVNVPMGGNNGGKIGGFDNGGSSSGGKAMQFQQQQQGGGQPELKLNAKPQTPNNPQDVQAPQQPQKGLLVPAIQKVRE